MDVDPAVKVEQFDILLCAHILFMWLWLSNCDCKELEKEHEQLYDEYENKVKMLN